MAHLQLVGEGTLLEARPVVARKKAVGHTKSGSDKLGGAIAKRRIAPDDNHRRNYRHAHVLATVKVSTHDRHAGGFVINMSEAGMMLETALEVAPHDRVTIDFDSFGRFEGTVVWARQGRVGISLGDSGIDLVPIAHSLIKR